MNKKIKNLKAFAASALLASSIVLTGCSSNKSLSDYSDEEIKEEYERRSEEIANFKGETKIYESGQHLVQIVGLYTESIESKSMIECPKGYELVSTWAYSVSGNKYIGYIFCNTQSVEVKSDENGEFTDFGIPIEMEKNETIQKVKNK